MLRLSQFTHFNKEYIMTVEVTEDFNKQELAWARKQIEYARFERIQKKQANDLVWVTRLGGKFQVTEKGQLRYTKEDLFPNRNAAIAAASARLETRLMAEDERNPNHTFIRTVVMRDQKEDI
jgi:hypothetical protein